MVEQQSIVPQDFENFIDKYRQGMKIVIDGAQAETGQTPKEVIWSKNKARLYHYQTADEKKHRTPILIVYALINRPYVLDLLPGNSFVEFLLSEGYDVYMLDWGIPGDEDNKQSFDHYVLDYIHRAARKVMRSSGTDEFTLLGYCMGGTMTAMYAALFPEKLKNLILITAPVDFDTEHIGMYRLFTSDKYLDVSSVTEAFGNIPGDMIDTGNRMLKPINNYIGNYVTMWDRVMQDKPMENWLAMSKWINDGPPFPGEAFKMWIRDFYQHNKLVKGEIYLRGRQVDLSNIQVPLLSVAGQKDHICAPPQAGAIIDLVSSSDKEFFVLDAGHVGLMTGSGARKNLWPKVNTWLESRSD